MYEDEGCQPLYARWQPFVAFGDQATASGFWNPKIARLLGKLDARVACAIQYEPNSLSEEMLYGRRTLR
jgi:hypothetical protein